MNWTTKLIAFVVAAVVFVVVEDVVAISAWRVLGKYHWKTRNSMQGSITDSTLVSMIII